MKTRIDHIIKELESAGYQTLELEEIKNGINSNVYKIKISKDTFAALKIYPKMCDLDQRQRQVHESEFIGYANEAGVASHVPNIIYKNESEGWTLFHWIEGNHISEITLQDIEKIVNFTRGLNADIPKLKKRRGQMKYASEACIDLEDFCEILIRRSDKLIAVKPKSEFQKKISKWVYSQYAPAVKEACKCLLMHKSKAHWHDNTLCSFASPSDVGIHNMKKVDNELIFFDFEYAGRDDLSKLVNDWCLQPRNIFTQEMTRYMVDLLANNADTFGDAWRDRFEDIKEVVALKWILIMLNSNMKYQSDSKLQRVNLYINKISSMNIGNTTIQNQLLENLKEL